MINFPDYALLVQKHITSLDGRLRKAGLTNYADRVAQVAKDFREIMLDLNTIELPEELQKTSGFSTPKSQVREERRKTNRDRYDDLINNTTPGATLNAQGQTGTVEKTDASGAWLRFPSGDRKWVNWWSLSKEN